MSTLKSAIEPAANDNRPRLAAPIHALGCHCTRCGGRDAFERDTDSLIIGLGLALAVFPVLVAIRYWPEISAAIVGLVS
jgi:hypothetical protein